MKDISPSIFFDLASYQHNLLFKELQKPWDALSKIKQYLASQELGKIEVEVPNGVYLINPDLISIGAGTILEPGAYIKGPCMIGKNCTVRHGAYIRGDFICGDDCVIGHDTEIKSAIFLNDVRAGHFAYVGDSILGNHVNLGAGTKCANLKLDNGKIFVKIDNELIETGLKKFGAIIGDNTQTGCNSVLNPGTLMGKNSACYPCTNFGGYIEAYHVVRPTQHVEVVKLNSLNIR
jgi:NDP-sugar pyrophosphorylase family protein